MAGFQLDRLFNGLDKKKKLTDIGLLVFPGLGNGSFQWIFGYLINVC